MALPVCTISGRVYVGNGQVARNAKIKAVKIIHPDELISPQPVVAFSDTNGDFEMDLPRGASVWLYGEVQRLNVNGIAGVELQIPDAATGELKLLIPPTNTPNTVPVVIPSESFAANFGDGAATEFTITHNLESEDLFVCFRLASGTKESVSDIAWKPDPDDPENAIIITTTVVPTANQLRVVIKK